MMNRFFDMVCAIEYYASPLPRLLNDRSRSKKSKPNFSAMPGTSLRPFPPLLIHLAVWGALLLFPLAFSASEGQSTGMFIKLMLPVLASGVVFYGNYFGLIDKLFFPKQYMGFILANAALILAVVLALEFISEHYLLRQGSRFRPLHIYRLVFTLLLSGGVSLGVKVLQRWRKSEEALQARQNEHLISTLAHLRYQIQPHFFFNSLNTIYAFIDTAPEKAKDTVISMSKLMRYMLYEAASEKTPLSAELSFLQSYIALMRTRLDERVEIQTDLPAAAEQSDLQLAPLLFIPLVENAFKHGVSSMRPSSICISLRLEGSRLAFETVNTHFPKDKDDQGGSGIGLHNLRQRLALLYPGRHALDFRTENNFYYAQLTITL